MELSFNNNKRKPTFLVITEDEKGMGWEPLIYVISSLLVVPSMEVVAKEKQCRDEIIKCKNVGPLNQSYARVVKED